jgi:hypothetical protein
MAFFGAIFSKDLLPKSTGAGYLDLGSFGSWAIPYLYVAILIGALFGFAILCIYWESQTRLQKSKTDILTEMEKYEKERANKEDSITKSRNA